MAEKTTIKKRKNERNEYTFPKSNVLSLSRSDYTLDESRIFSILFWQIGQSDEWKEYYDIDAPELIEMLGMESGQHLYNELMSIAESIVSKTMLIKQDDQWDVINIVRRASYKRGRGKLRLYVAEDVHQFLKSILGNYTIFDLRNFLAIKSFNGFRMYDILRTQAFNKRKGEDFGRYVIGLEELKAMMGMSDKYPLYGDFKKRVLEPTKKEIGNKTDISFEYEELKTGRKVTLLEFKIRTQTPERAIKEQKLLEGQKKAEVEEQKQKLIEEREKVFIRLQGFGISEKDVFSLLKKYEDDYLNENLDYVDVKRKAGTIDKLAAYTITTIHKDYASEDREKKLEVETRKQNRIKREQAEQEELDRQTDQKIIYIDSIYEQVELLITDEIAKSFIDSKMGNPIIKSNIIDANIPFADFKNNPYVSNAFAEYLACKLLPKEWHTFEAWDASQDT